MTDDTAPKRRGRPPKPEADRKGSNLTFRTRGDLRDQLAAASEASGRSISEEIEDRLARSFEAERRAALDAALLGGGRNLEILQTMAAVLMAASKLDGGEFTATSRFAVRFGLERLANVMIGDAASPDPRLEGCDYPTAHTWTDRLQQVVDSFTGEELGEIRTASRAA